MNYYYDLFIKKIDTLTHALEKANERCRLMLYVITLGSVLLLVVAFNAYYSWNRKLNAKDRLLLSEEIGAVSPWQMRQFNYELGKDIGVRDLEGFHQNISKNVLELDRRVNRSIQTPYDLKVADALTKYFNSLSVNGLLIDKFNYFEAFFKRQTFTIPLLGLSCSETDLFCLGGLFMLILLIYSYYNARREERIVYRMIKSMKFIESEDINVSLGINEIERSNHAAIDSIKYRAMEIVFQGSINSFVYTTIANDSDDYWVYENLEATITRLPNSDGYWQSLHAISYSNNMASWIKKHIDYLPIVSLSILGICDVVSYFNVFSYLSSSDVFEFWVKFTLGAIFLFIGWKQCRIINIVNTNIAYQLMHMHKIIKDYRTRLKSYKK